MKNSNAATLDLPEFAQKPRLDRMGKIQPITVFKLGTGSYKVWLEYTNSNGEGVTLFSRRQRSYKKADALRTRLIVFLINHGKRLFHMLPTDPRRSFVKVSPHVLSYDRKMMYRGSGDCTDLLLSMRSMGQFNPILIDTKGKVIAGLRRYFCALALGKDILVQVSQNPIREAYMENQHRR